MLKPRDIRVVEHPIELVEPKALESVSCRVSPSGNLGEYNFEGPLKCRIYSNHRLLRAAPFNIEKIAGSAGIEFMSAVSGLRLVNSPHTADDVGLPYYRTWVNSGGAGVCPLSGSFRRHIVPVRFGYGGVESMVEAKIPGQDPAHFELSYKDFMYPFDVLAKCGPNAGLVEPILMADYSGDGTLYGARRAGGLRMILFRYYDNKRLDDRNEGPLGRRYLENVAGNSSTTVEGLVGRTASDVMGILGNIHSSGILLNGEAYLWNYILTDVGGVKYVCDFGSSSQLSEPGEYAIHGIEEKQHMLREVGERLLEPNIGEKKKREEMLDIAERAYLTSVKKYNPALLEDRPD